jgi:membrane protein YqaA with SNARE-associated domain
MSIFATPPAGITKPHVHHMRLLHSLAHLGPFGVFAVAALDSSVIPLPVPGATDLMVLWLASRSVNIWVLLLCAVTGSLLGGYTSWRIGRKGGQIALRRYVPERLLKPMCNWIEHHSILSVAVFPMLPPPIPLTPFVLASGALGVSSRRFLVVFGLARTLRYSLVAWIGVTYGRHVVRMWNATLDQWSSTILWMFAAIVAVAIGAGLWRRYARGRSRILETPLVEAGFSQTD